MSGQQSLGDDYLAQQPRVPALNTNVVVAVLIVLFIAIFLMLVIHLYARLFWSRAPTLLLIRGRLAAARSHQLQAPACPPTGLDAATIAALPTFTYAVSVHAAADASSPHAPLLECAVCLSEFQENEKGRLLPPCQHAFHTECIDMWFSSHSTCPLCRTDVLPAETPANDQHQPDEEQEEAAAQSLDIEESPAALSNRRSAQLPCNVLVWGNGVHVTSAHESSFSSPAIISSLTAESDRPRTRALPQITITIPPMGEGVVLTTPRRYSFSKSACLPEEHAAACSSQQASISTSPGLGASLKRMLSRKPSGKGVLANEGSHHQ